MKTRICAALLLSSLCGLSFGTQSANARWDEIGSKRVPWTGNRVTFNKLVEAGFSAILPKEFRYSYRGISLTVRRDNVICEQCETNHRGDYKVTVRARYSGTVSILGVGVVQCADRLRVKYANGHVSVDIGGMHGVVNTRAILNWLRVNLLGRVV